MKGNGEGHGGTPEGHRRDTGGTFQCPAVSRPCPAVSRPCPAVSRPCPAMSRPCPALSRPSPAMSRPSPAMSRPSPAMSRPCPAMSRPFSMSVVRGWNLYPTAAQKSHAVGSSTTFCDAQHVCLLKHVSASSRRHASQKRAGCFARDKLCGATGRQRGGNPHGSKRSWRGQQGREIPHTTARCRTGNVALVLDSHHSRRR